jgi:hypothetical protein
MFERIKELIHPIVEGHEDNYASIDELPVDDSNADGDKDASKPPQKR